MNKNLLTLSLAAISSANAADILIHAAGDDQRLVLEHNAFHISEQRATNMFAAMLFTELLNAGRMQYSIAGDIPGIEQLGALPETDGCTLLAIELHFNPEERPDGAGNGLWIATDPEDATATKLAQYTIEAWSSKTHTPYRSAPLHHVQPETYHDPYSGETCPAIYVNLDTFNANTPSLWPTQPQSVHYYARDLAHAINAALTLNTEQHAEI